MILCCSLTGGIKTHAGFNISKGAMFFIAVPFDFSYKLYKALYSIVSK